MSPKTILALGILFKEPDVGISSVRGFVTLTFDEVDATVAAPDESCVQVVGQAPPVGSDVPRVAAVQSLVVKSPVLASLQPKARPERGKSVVRLR